MASWVETMLTVHTPKCTLSTSSTLARKTMQPAKCFLPARAIPLLKETNPCYSGLFILFLTSNSHLAPTCLHFDPPPPHTFSVSCTLVHEAGCGSKGLITFC